MGIVFIILEIYIEEIGCILYIKKKFKKDIIVL